MYNQKSTNISTIPVDDDDCGIGAIGAIETDGNGAGIGADGSGAGIGAALGGIGAETDGIGA